MTWRVALLWLVAAWALCAPRARAAGDCPPGNLLAGSSPSQAVQVRAPERLTDGVLCLPSDHWDTHLTAVLETAGSYVVFDLGREIPVRALLIQGHAGSRYRFQVSADGERWSEIAVTPVDPRGGMRAHRGLFQATGRYLRIDLAGGSVPTGLGEVQAFCQVPENLAPPVVFRQGRPRVSAVEAVRTQGWGKGALALLAAVALAALRLRRQRRALPGWRLVLGLSAGLGAALAAVGLTWGAGVAAACLLVPVAVVGVHLRVQAPQLLRTIAFISLIVASALTWTDFDALRSVSAHTHDIFHYVMGARYSREIGYDRLYHCAVVAEAQGQPAPDLPRRAVRDLHENVVRSAAEFLADPEACTDHFTPERWEAFRGDLDGFRALMTAGEWDRLFEDHGYNAPPTWSLLGRAFAGGRGVDAGRVQRWTWLDPALYLLVFGLLLWAFGIEVTALAAVVFAVGAPWEVTWLGGTFGRAPWFVVLTVAVCLARRGHAGASGAAWAVAVLLRVFPLLMGIGLVLHGVHRWIRDRTLPRPTLRFFGGAVLATALLIPASGWYVGGMDGYRSFLENIDKHRGGTASNRMGWETVLSWHPDRSAEQLYDWGLQDPSEPYVQAREQTLQQRRVVRIVGIALGAVLLALLAVRRLEAWELLAISGGLAMLVLDLACYYYLFVVLLAPVAAARTRAWGVLLAAVAATTLLRATLSVSFEVPWVLDSALMLGAWVWIAGERGSRRPGVVQPLNQYH